MLNLIQIDLLGQNSNYNLLVDRKVQFIEAIWYPFSLHVTF